MRDNCPSCGRYVSADVKQLPGTNFRWCAEHMPTAEVVSKRMLQALKELNEWAELAGGMNAPCFVGMRQAIMLAEWVGITTGEE